MVLKGFNGRDGWLGLLILGLILGPLFYLGKTHNEFNTLADGGVLLNSSFIGYSYASVVIEGIFYWRAASILIKANDRRAPFRAMGHIWAGLLFGFVSVLLIFDTFYPAFTAAAAWESLGGFVWGVVWTLYLFFSKRVKNTYCENSPASVGSEPVRRQIATAPQAEAMRAVPAGGEDGAPVAAPDDEEALVHELRMFKLPSSGQWYWAAKNRRGQLLARGGPLKTWMECAKQFHAGGYR